jgi:hypothetical protein
VVYTELWIAGALLILCVAGMISLSLQMRKSAKKSLFIVGTVILGLCSLVVCVYLILGGIMVSGIRQLRRGENAALDARLVVLFLAAYKTRLNNKTGGGFHQPPPVCASYSFVSQRGQKRI